MTSQYIIVRRDAHCWVVQGEQIETVRFVYRADALNHARRERAIAQRDGVRREILIVDKA